MIELVHLKKQFGDRWAVEDLTLEVKRGEIYGLLGHNGAGKSTAIGMMLGQVWPTGGSARVCGYDVTQHRHQALEKVGAIFETPVFYDYLSGWRNLHVLSSYSAAVDKTRLKEVIRWVGLSGREHERVKTYSHGMRSRLALAQALLPEPELLILDEPSDGLDPEGIHEMRQTILRLRDELGLTILLSSHLLAEVEQLCGRIAVLHQGRKVHEGSMADVKQAGNWFRLVTDDFAAASQELLQAGLIRDVRAGRSVQLAERVGSDRVTRHLVESGRPVYEIVREEQSLETFYLGLMRDAKDPSAGVHQ